MNDELLQAEKQAQDVIKLARELYVQGGLSAVDALHDAEKFLEAVEEYRLDKIRGAL
jgi:outer membrane protein TolC